MNNTADHDEMSGTYSEQNAPAPEGSIRDGEQENVAETVEEFRKRHKHHEGYFDRAEPFSSLSSSRGFGYHRRSNTALIDVFIEYIDGFAIGGLLAIVMWLIFPKPIPIIIAGVIGFIGGVYLKLIVHDRYPKEQAIRQGLPVCIVAVIIALMLIYPFAAA